MLFKACSVLKTDSLLPLSYWSFIVFLIAIYFVYLLFLIEVWLTYNIILASSIWNDSIFVFHRISLICKVWFFLGWGFQVFQQQWCIIISMQFLVTEISSKQFSLLHAFQVQSLYRLVPILGLLCFDAVRHGNCRVTAKTVNMFR